MAKKPFEPQFKTFKEEENRVELIKGNSLFVNREVAIQFNELHVADVSIDVEQYAKSYGIYLEFDRSKKGRDFDWMYMIRIGIPGGGPITRDQWNILNELADKHTKDPDGAPSLRLTTRQAIQFHWVKKSALKDIIKTCAEAGMISLNGCGDNTRNVMACPLSQMSDIYNGWDMAQKTADYFRLPAEPYMKIFEIDPNAIRTPGEGESFKYGPKLLNRKFKIAFSALHRDSESGIIVPDNCVELRTHDMSIAPILENEKVVAYQIYIGGGQGERNGFPTTAALGEPFAIVSKEQLFPTMDAIVSVHQEWGDRENRFWARMKYVLKAKGLDWYHDQVTARLGFPLTKPNPEHDYGDRKLHHGWWKQPKNSKWTFGAYIENGRLIDGGINGDLKKMVHNVMHKYDIELQLTPNQDLLFSNIEEAAKEEFEAELTKYGYGKRNGKPYSTLRRNSGACVGRNTCRLTYTDSEKLEPKLLDQLEEMGWSDIAESIGITGCERQCFRPATKSIGIIGTGLNLYTFKLFGDESARSQGRPVVVDNKYYLRFVKRDQLAIIIDSLFKDFSANKNADERLGEYHRRIGDAGVVKALADNPDTAAFVAKTFHTDFLL